MTHDRINLRRRKQEGTPECQINLRNRKASALEHVSPAHGRLAEARDKALEEAAKEVNKLTVSMARIGEHPMANQSKAQAVSDLLEVTELMIRSLQAKP